MFRNEEVEAEKKTSTIKVKVQPASGSHHPKTSTGMLARIPLTQMYSLGSSFKYEEINYMLAEAMEEYASDSVETAYEDPRE